MWFKEITIPFSHGSFDGVLLKLSKKYSSDYPLVTVSPNRSSPCAHSPRRRLSVTSRIFTSHNPLSSGEIILRLHRVCASPVKRIIEDIGAHRDKQTAVYDGLLPRERGIKLILFSFVFFRCLLLLPRVSLSLKFSFRRENILFVKAVHCSYKKEKKKIASHIDPFSRNID